MAVTAPQRQDEVQPCNATESRLVARAVAADFRVSTATHALGGDALLPDLRGAILSSVKGVHQDATGSASVRGIPRRSSASVSYRGVTAPHPQPLCFTTPTPFSPKTGCTPSVSCARSTRPASRECKHPFRRCGFNLARVRHQHRQVSARAGGVEGPDLASTCVGEGCEVRAGLRRKAGRR
jgi:hypothetical protein